MAGVSLTRILFLVFTFLLPFRTVLLFNLGGKTIQASDMIFVILLVFFLIDMIMRKIKFIRSLFYLPFIFYLLAHLFSCLNAVDRQKAMLETGGVLYLTLIFIIGFHLITSREFLEKLIKTWLAALTVVVVFGFVGLFEVYILKSPDSQFMLIDCASGRYQLMHNFMPRVCSILGNPNMLMSYFILSVGFAGYCWNQANRILRYLIIFLIVSVVILSSLTISRDIAGLFISIYFCLLAVRRVNVFLNRGIRICLISAVTLLVPVFAVLTIWEPSQIKVASTGSAGEQELTVDFHRTNKSYYYEYALQMAAEHPFIGSGSGNYNLRLRGRYLNDPKADPGFAPFSANDPHSTYLGLLAETGVFGLLSFFGIIITLIAALVNNIRRPYPGQPKELPLFIIAGLIGILFQALTMDIQNLRHLWVIFALGFALSRKNSNFAQNSER